MLTALTLPTLFGRVTALQSDHRAPFATFHQLHESCGTAGRAADTRQTSSHLFDELLTALSDHFSAEEADGYFGTIVAERPSLSREVSALRAEHAAILTAMTALAHIASVGAASFKFVSAVQHGAEWFHAHEQRESQILREFLLPAHQQRR